MTTSGSAQGRPVALVTGVGRSVNIGAAIAAQLAGDGYDIAFTYWAAYDERMTWGPERGAEAWTRLMTRLGYEHFFVQGGDWGAFVSTAMDERFPDRVVAKPASDRHACFLQTDSGHEPRTRRQDRIYESILFGLASKDRDDR